MSKDSNRISKEPLRSFISKVGTFRGKKYGQSRPSSSDLKYTDSIICDETILRNSDDSSYPNFNGNGSESSTDLDSTKLSGGNNSYRTSMQASVASTNIYDRMTNDQINEEFEKSLLTGLNLKSDKDIEKMRVLPIEYKKNLLINMRKNENEMDDKAFNMATTLKQSVRDSRSLRENLKQLYKIIKRISVCIAHKPISWLKEFNEAGGFLAIQDIILECKMKYSTLYNNNNGSQYYNSSATMVNQNNYNSLNLGNGNNSNYNLFTYNNNEFKDKDTNLIREIRYECIKTLKSFVNTTFGINVVLENKTTLMAIATAIDCNHSSTMNLACTILAVLAVLDHERILIAIGDASKFTGKHRFYSIVRGLIIDDDKELEISSMILINALICHAEGVDFKIHLRSDFSRCGLIQAIDILKQKYGDNQNIDELELDPLMKQILIFENHSHDNFEEIDSQVENFDSVWDDTKTCFEYVNNTIKDTPAEFCLLSILHHLLLIRDDVNIRYSYYRLIEDCVAKIVLFKDGRDPDFECGSKFDLDVDSIIKVLSNSSIESSSFNGKMSNFDTKKLENVISEKQELEAKVQTLSTKLKCTEEALDDLKLKVPNEVASEIELMLLKRLNTELLSNKTSSLPPPPPPPPPPPMPPSLMPKNQPGGPPPPPPPPPPPFMGFGGAPPPPPPPMPGFGGPPAPPPFNGFGGPPPPPPMGGFGGPKPPQIPSNKLPFGMKEKKKYNVDQPLKRINWNKVQTQKLKENSFWVRANEEKYANDDICQILIENFSTKTAKTKLVDSKSSEEPSSKKRGGPSKELKFIDEKLAQNLLIKIKTLKADPNEIYKWIAECDLPHGDFDASTFADFEKLLPEDQIIVKYQDLKENIAELDQSEQFLVVISQLKGVRRRLRNLIFKLKFSDLNDDIKQSLVAGTQACTDVRNSEKFQKLLEVLLFVGNFMNSGSSNLEGTIGFDMKFLPKFFDTKANDNKRTLLHLVVQIISDKYPNIFDFYDDFNRFIDTASRIDPTNIQKSLSEIKNSLSNLDLDIRNANQKKHEPLNEKFIQIMSPFLKDCQFQFETLECMHTKMNDAYKELAEFYAFEITKYSICEFFTDLKVFSELFQRCHSQNKEQNEREEKERRNTEEKTQREKEKQARKQQKEQLIQTHGESDDTGVMDHLLEALQSGKLFQAGHSGNQSNSPGGLGARPRRRDNNSLMNGMQIRRTMKARNVAPKIQ